MAGRRTRSSIQLCSLSKQRSRSESLSKESNVKKVKTREEIREYEKIKKRNQRQKKRDTAGPAKLGAKIKVNIKEMSQDERKAYNGEKQKLSRAKKTFLRLPLHRRKSVNRPL
jgi:predicted metal-dependent peptidase